MGFFQTIKTLAFASQELPQQPVPPAVETPLADVIKRGMWKIPESMAVSAPAQPDFHKCGQWRVCVADLTTNAVQETIGTRGSGIAKFDTVVTARASW